MKSQIKSLKKNTINNGIKRSKKSSILLWVATIAVTFVTLFPIVWIVSSSFTDEKHLYSLPVHYVPENPTLDNYKSLFATLDIGGMAINTLVIALITIIATILISYMAAYGFARSRFFGKDTIYSLLTFSSMLPMIITLVPLSRMMRMFHLTDTVWGLSILYISSYIPFTTMIFTNALREVPVALDEAAEVDGAGLFRTMFQIVLPLIKPVVATMAIIIFIWSLNEFMIPLVFSSEDAVTLSVGLSQVPRVTQYALPWEKISAMGTMIILPIILFVTIFQRQIMDGLMAGGVKQ